MSSEVLSADFVARLEARRRVKLGPGELVDDTGGPAEILRQAQQAAGRGELSVATPVEVRRMLSDLERDLRAAGAWSATEPLWWHPLAEAGPAESLWEACEQALAGRLAEDGCVAGEDWRVLPDLLPGGRCDAITARLEAARDDGVLRMEPGTVGPSARIAAERSDEVVYLTGREPALLGTDPELAALVQWLLEGCAPRLATWWRREERRPASIHPPARAMLARYPAPAAGFRPHLDNPGGAHDNGRALTAVLYLGHPSRPCKGGELALWGRSADPRGGPTRRVRPSPGTLALFDARAVRHEVEPMGPGSPRWSLTIWLNASPQAPPGPPHLPAIGVTEALLGIESPPLPRESILCHDLSVGEAGRLDVHARPPGRVRAGIVATVHGEGAWLEGWCRHHLQVGFQHLLLVFDRLDEPAEAELAGRLRRQLAPGRITIWSGGQLAARDWRGACPGGEGVKLRRFARGGASAQAVAARQTLNASAALEAARMSELGGRPLDWLVHLDGDELFWLHGPCRGGDEAGEHFALLETAGIRRARYVNHELLAPAGGPHGARPRFKRNAAEARARLGRAGWRAVARRLARIGEGARPYFHGYANGKSAVAVRDGAGAAGVHGWALRSGATHDREVFLAGPSVLHFHLRSPDRFIGRYLDAASGPATAEPTERLFEPYPLDAEATRLAADLSGAAPPRRRAALAELWARWTHVDVAEVELLEAAGLLFEPDLGSRFAAGL